MPSHSLSLLALFALGACAATGSAESTTRAHDAHSFSEPERVRVTHVALDLQLDFDRHQVVGLARLDLERTDPEAPLVLDTMGLAIQNVTGSDRRARPFALGPEKEGFGAPLTIELEPGDTSVTVAYATGREAEALQWLSPEQTAGGRHPFLFTQGQAILTRTWIPLQDSPGVRVTYEAAVRAPAPLTVVMSAERVSGEPGGVWRYRLDRPIPPYLIALGCGELATRALSERCAVWAEPSVVAAAAAEFADTEAMVQAAEALFGPYRWGRYDLLILPPSFPYGGMENPRLTFVTPTVIAGDRSLVSLVAHELAHSWSGNLVTNATWRDFWLNEGFTVYFEGRIMERVYGMERADMERVLALDELREEVERLEPWQTVLYIDLAGHHPDDGFSGVPYIKGALFLQRLEQVFGRERFDRALTAWFDGHAFTSVTTPDFERFLEKELFSKAPDLAAQVDVQAWLHEPGIPADVPVTESAALARVDAEVERWRSGTPAAELETEGWVTQQWLRFLEGMPDDLDPERMAELDRAFGFTGRGNYEVLAAWLELAARDGYTAADERCEEFLMTVGRRKFLRPLYEALMEADAARARAIYAKARPRYHAVSTGTLDRIVLEPE